MAVVLPESLSLSQVEAFHLDAERWLPAVRALCLVLGLPAQDVRPFSDGVNLVCAVGDASVLKLYPPVLWHQFEAESRTLRFVQGKLSFPMPRILTEGTWEGWPYLLMSRLDGAPLEGKWASLPEPDQVRILSVIGRWMHEVHALPLSDEPVREMPPRWQDFLPAQVRACEARHRRLGLPEPLAEEIPAWLDRAGPELRRVSAAPAVLLTGEYTPFNLLLGTPVESQAPGLTGMIDFGDAMIGPAEYDLLGPFSFLCGGSVTRLRALLQGRGWDLSAGERRATRTRWMALLLLHRYSDLRSQVRIAGALDQAMNIEELACRIWPDALWTD